MTAHAVEGQKVFMVAIPAFHSRNSIRSNLSVSKKRQGSRSNIASPWLPCFSCARLIAHFVMTSSSGLSPTLLDFYFVVIAPNGLFVLHPSSELKKTSLQVGDHGGG
jgi:hypothetical protein